MKNKVMVIALMPIILNAQSYEDRFYRDKNHHPSKIGIHSDVGYSSYMVEFHSSELDSAISYDILEFTLGASYSYDTWMWGIFGKFMIDELQSNMDVVPTGERRNDHAKINKDEFALYTNYTLSQNQRDALRINALYRYAHLDARDSYLSYNSYESLFRYRTQGLALSLVYSQILTEYSSCFINFGLIYSMAEVEISESIGSKLQDSYVDDISSAIGIKFSAGYNHKVFPNLFLNIRTDVWQSNFGTLQVKSRVGDRLPRATLTEQSFTLSTGVTWHF